MFEDFANIVQCTGSSLHFHNPFWLNDRNLLLFVCFTRIMRVFQRDMSVINVRRRMTVEIPNINPEN